MIIVFDSVYNKTVEKMNGDMVKALEIAKSYSEGNEKISRRTVKVQGGRKGICFSSSSDFEVIYFEV